MKLRTFIRASGRVEDAYEMRIIRVWFPLQSNVSMYNFAVKKSNIDFHRHPMLVRTNTPFLLAATVTSSLVRSRNMNYTSASFTEPRSLMPLISSEVSPESSRFFPPLLPLNEGTVRFSPLSSRSVILSSNTCASMGFRWWFWPLSSALTPTMSSHHRRKLPDYSNLWEGCWNEIWDLYCISLLN